MRLKPFSINHFLILVSTYISLLFVSFFDFNFLSTRGIESKVLNQSIEKKLLAIKNGFIPVFNPHQILVDTKTKKIYPIGSLPSKPTFYCDEGYGLITYKTDRFGLRNNDSKWQNIFSTQTVFIIGDSYIHGACVPEFATITSVLEKSLTKNVINLGTANNGPYEYISIMKSMINPIIKKSNKNNIVIKAFYDNDNQRNNLEKENLIRNLKPIVKLNSQKGIEPTKEYSENLLGEINNYYALSKKDLEFVVKKNRPRFFYEMITLYPLRKRIKLISNLNFGSSSNLQGEKFAQSPSFQSLQFLSNSCQNKCKPYVVYIPNSNYWRPNSKSNQNKIELKNISKKTGIKFIDGEKVIDKNDRNNYAPKGGHLSLSGNKKIAELISETIKSNY